MAVVSGYNGNRDVSFSCYLDSAERDFVRNLSESIHSPSPARETASTTPRGRRSSSSSSGSVVFPRSELGVFGAHSYFSDKLDAKKTSSINANRHKHRPDKKRDDHHHVSSSKDTNLRRRSPLKSPTPSLRSEASSWSSSQLGLLSLPKKTTAAVGLRIFQCRGSCFDKKSVHTAPTHFRSAQSSPTRYPAEGRNKMQGQSRKTSRLSQSHQDYHFAFPIIDTAPPKNNNRNIIMDDPPRKSLEVFGLHHIGKQDIADNLERKLSILAWDAIVPAKSTFPFSSSYSNSRRTSFTHNIPRNSDENHDQDVRSEASSELFEIEHLSGVSMGPTTTQLASPTTTENQGYEPSEASIEWSAVTASATNFSVVSDDHDDDTKVMMTRALGMTTSKNIIGCQSHEAVDVVENSSLHRKIITKYDKLDKFDFKGSPNIAPSTPSRRSSYALAYA